MSRYRLTVAYDGTAYAGWQVQPGVETVQLALERAIGKILQLELRVFCSGRTDAGVHGEGQVIHFNADRELDPFRFCHSVNAVIAPDIRVRDLQSVPDDWNARFDVLNKTYRYRIWNGAAVPPFFRLYRTHVSGELDDAAMREAAALLVGEYDFASFSANPNREMDSTVRTVFKLDVIRDGAALDFEVQGSGFLYKMVRSIAGCLISVGQGKLTVEEVQVIRDAAERSQAVSTAPSLGLFLWEVVYRDTIN